MTNESGIDEVGITRMIGGGYLMVCHIPVFRDKEGVRWIDDLWYKDLVQHVEYIENFTIACPCIDGPSPGNSVRVEDRRIKFVDLPGRYKLTLRLPWTFFRLFRGVGDAEIVHTGLGGWLPISLGNMTAFLAKVRRRFLIVIVESAPWRLVPGSRPSIVARLKSVLAESMNRWCLNHVDLAVFTQARYKQSLMRRRQERGHVIHASWIDEDVIISNQQAMDSWDEKVSGVRRARASAAGADPQADDGALCADLGAADESAG